MKRSSGRFLTTPTGSLPRPDELAEMLFEDCAGTLTDRAGLESRVASAVAEAVRRQAELGLDVIGDGEMSKISYATYVTQRLSGFDAAVESPRPVWPDMADFPTFAKRYLEQSAASPRVKLRTCTGEVRYVGHAALEQDMTNLQAALTDLDVEEVFVTAASPGLIAFFHRNHFYKEYDDYVWALAEAMKVEYGTIARKGFLLQLDCPDLTFQFGLCADDAQRKLKLHLAALDYSLADIPPDRLRLHLCWGNYEGPHHHDVPLSHIIGPVLAARPMAISIEGANPRHAHEWKVFEEIALPPDKIIMPGVLDSTTNYVEHPELVAERILRYARAVGPEQVIAGTDCGFGTTAGPRPVDPDIAYAKLKALVDGARLASQEVWA